jgi:hypothetical protein
VLEIRKQKKGNHRKRVYVSADLVSQLQILARDQRLGYRGFYFRFAKSGDEPMSGAASSSPRGSAWRSCSACCAIATFVRRPAAPNSRTRRSA